MIEVESNADAAEIATRSVSVGELRDFARACGLSQAALERCSTVFLFQLYAGAFISNVFGDAAKILAEVKHLEGIGRAVGTRPAEQFKKHPLLGLYKKHYLVGGLASMGRNILLGAGKKKRELRRIVEKHHNPAYARLPFDVVVKHIAYDVTNLYAKRSSAQNLTGNWIVFAQHEGKNYYLCLAEHDEGDDTIAARIKDGCFTEFPFLRPSLKF